MSDPIWPHVHVDGRLSHARDEWIVGNGAGAYASSTVALMHTRRYHGLLVAALEQPIKRAVIVSHFDTRIHDGRTDHALASHQFPAVPPKEGYRLLAHFHQDPLPRWTYEVGDGQLEKTLALVRGCNALVLRYSWTGPRPVAMSLRPLLALRSHHGLTRAHGAMIQRVQMRTREVSVQPIRNLPPVIFRHSGVFVGTPDWWHRFEYLAEQDRGLDFQEDLWSPGVFRIQLEPGVPHTILTGLGELPDGEEPDLLDQAADAIRSCDPGPSRCFAVRRLAIAADLFRADDCPTPSIIAGYPWFEVWGRHTLSCLPGLYLATKRATDAKAILDGLVRRMRDGLVPNRVPDDGRPAEYHEADATLMLFGVSRLVADSLPDDDSYVIDALLPRLRAAFEAIVAGNVEGIRVTPDGALAAGSHGTSLTWMDARVDSIPVTSRAGLPVELQAYWSRGCDDLARLADRGGNSDLASRARACRDAARKVFAERFWCERTSFPYDVVSDGAPDHAWADASVRPNALIALSVDPALFTRDQAVTIVERVERDLVTPAGIRTLAPGEPSYQGTYAGTIKDRDRAYHQGTAWPFLFGALARAIRHAYPGQPDRLDQLRQPLEELIENQLALGQVPEVADGDPPHRPDGCIAYGPSVAELLWVFVRELGL